jgi:hypothetical protein
MCINSTIVIGSGKVAFIAEYSQAAVGDREVGRREIGLERCLELPRELNVLP